MFIRCNEHLANKIIGIYLIMKVFEEAINDWSDHLYIPLISQTKGFKF